MARNMAFCSILLVPVCLASLVAPARAQHFNKVKGTVTSASAGRNEVFAFDVDANVYRYSASSESIHQNRQNKQLVDIAVGRGTLSQTDEVWGINASGDVFRFRFQF